MNKPNLYKIYDILKNLTDEDWDNHYEFDIQAIKDTYGETAYMFYIIQDIFEPHNPKTLDEAMRNLTVRIFIQPAINILKEQNLHKLICYLDDTLYNNFEGYTTTEVIAMGYFLRDLAAHTQTQTN
jgi:hypothetical protein